MRRLLDIPLLWLVLLLVAVLWLTFRRLSEKSQQKIIKRAGERLLRVLLI